jgi:hypothetical protein
MSENSRPSAGNVCWDYKNMFTVSRPNLMCENSRPRAWYIFLSQC